MVNIDNEIREEFEGKYDVSDVRINRQKVEIELDKKLENVDRDEIKDLISNVVGEENIISLKVTKEDNDLNDNINSVITFNYRK